MQSSPSSTLSLCDSRFPVCGNSLAAPVCGGSVCGGSLAVPVCGDSSPTDSLLLRERVLEPTDDFGV